MVEHKDAAASASRKGHDYDPCPRRHRFHVKHSSSSVANHTTKTLFHVEHQPQLRLGGSALVRIGERATSAPRKERLDFAHDASAKCHYAGDKYGADDDRDPGSNSIRQIFLESDHDSSAKYRPEKGPGTPDQCHQDDFAGITLRHIREGYEPEYQRFDAARQTR